MAWCHILQISQTEPIPRKAPGENARFPFLESSAVLQEIMGRLFSKPLKYTLICRSEGPSNIPYVTTTRGYETKICGYSFI